MSPEAYKRLFVGTFLSPGQQEVLARASQHKAELESGWQAKIRFVKPHKLHLTWLFLGDVAVSSIEDISARLQVIASRQKQLDITYDQVEFWPSDKRPRMVVLTPKFIADRVMEMASSVEQELKQYVSKPGHKVYRPHITLARLERYDFNARQVVIPASFHIESLRHEITKIELIESELGKATDEYQSLKSFGLQ